MAQPIAPFDADDDDDDKLVMCETDDELGGEEAGPPVKGDEVWGVPSTLPPVEQEGTEDRDSDDWSVADEGILENPLLLSALGVYPAPAPSTSTEEWSVGSAADEEPPAPHPTFQLTFVPPRLTV